MAPLRRRLLRSLWFGIFFLSQIHCASVPPSSSISTEQPLLGVRQLTGTELKPGQFSFPQKGPADPAHYVTADGRIQVFGTQSRNGYLEYPDWKSFLKGERMTMKYLTLLHPDGTKIEGEESVWDLIPFNWGHEEVLYGGAMTPTGGRREARWPQDNWNRRIYAFHKDANGDWVRASRPLFSPPLAKETWKDHCYGHHFIRDDSGTVWIFYERVSQALDPQGKPAPYKTEIFAREMVDPSLASREERAILRIGAKPLPSMRRTVGGFLVEGPRPQKVQLGGETFYFIGFSSGDFSTDHYTINVAWSKQIDRGYKPILTPDGTDLLDLGKEIKSRLGLSWGPARPDFFQDPEGQWWVLFHAVRKDILPDNDYTRWPSRDLAHFHRNIYLAPVEITRGPDGGPSFRIGSRFDLAFGQKSRFVSPGLVPWAATERTYETFAFRHTGVLSRPQLGPASPN